MNCGLFYWMISHYSLKFLWSQTHTCRCEYIMLQKIVLISLECLELLDELSTILLDSITFFIEVPVESIALVYSVTKMGFCWEIP